MREVAVTEGDKVEAQARLGYSVNTYGIGDLVARIGDAAESDVDKLVELYRDLYVIPFEHDRPESIRDAARSNWAYAASSSMAASAPLPTHSKICTE